MTAPPRLCCTNISKRFPGVRALDGVSLTVAPGSVHALVGENGAGKSTLMKILAGAQSADAGVIALDGFPVALPDARAAQRCGIAIVYQELNLIDDLSVSENIFLGRWPRRRMTRTVDFRRLHADAERLLRKLGLNLPVRQAVATLSVAQQQMVAIAKALSLAARVLILDEPSAVLTSRELDRLFALIRELRDRGVSVIYISHRLDEIFAIADVVTVLRDGVHISTRPRAEVTRPELIAEMVGRPLADEFPPRRSRTGAVVLRVEHLSASHRFAQVSFAVRGGEVFALTGLVGSGRSAVLRTIFGAVRATSGRVLVGTACGPFQSPRQAIAAGVGMLPEDRQRQGLLLERSLRENVTLAHPEAVSTAGVLRAGHERRAAAAAIADFHIKAASSEVAAQTLSGGNQQKVMLARWMSRPLSVLLFDEPTRGVDVGAKYEIYQLINRLAADGIAVVMVTSELPEAIGMADRIGVMHGGRLRGILDNSRRGVRQETIMQLAAGA